MLMTEEQAREKWCPQVRIARRETPEPIDGIQPVVVAGCNTDALGRNRVPASCRCIGSQCAMWRWVPSNTTHKERRVQEEKCAVLGGYPEMRKFEVTVDVPDDPTQGYCGLAGRPEVA